MMGYNEAETRFFLIDPVLRGKGYDEHWKLRLETPAPVEPVGAKGRRKKGPGRTDYLLCVQCGDMPRALPVGVIEAKHENEDPLKGMQQAKGYAECERFNVHYVFSTNGHRYAEFDKFTGMTNGLFQFSEFLNHDDLTARYTTDTGIDLTKPESSIMFMVDSPAFSAKPRYYQDAAIRAAFEKILCCRQAGEPARVLLALATGSGKTIIAANLLWRLHEAGQLPKPVLFLCDRDELREQAYTKLKAVFGDNARIVETRYGKNAARNARIHIATYQTLGLDDEKTDAPSFLTENYPEDAFSVIVIDECHRSAWGRWSEVLKRNPNAIHIGLTATPRQLRESENKTVEDAEITANNHKYFGEPVYEYTLIEAQEDGYLAACEIVKRRPSIDGRTFTSEEVLAAKPINAKTGKPITADKVKEKYTAKDFDDELTIPERIAVMCDDLFKQLCKHGGPEQKVIVFCTREFHADRVALHLNNLYALWCKEQGKVPKEYYAFKCMGTPNGGRDLIASLRGSGERAFIACTVDLLATGVDIERLNAVVFFRYLESSITFYQMVGRGTRIHEETGKYKFWLYDYTGVTDLFGTDFITKPPTGGGGGGIGPQPPTPPEDPPPIIEIAIHAGGIIDGGRHIPMRRNGRDVVVSLEEYRKQMIERVRNEAADLNQFRELWVTTRKRQSLIKHLLNESYEPERLRELEEMDEFDYFDIFAHHGYRAAALKRLEREQSYLRNHRFWFDTMDPNAAKVLRGIGRQFGIGGTEALETEALWEVPQIKRAGGIEALKKVGQPVKVMREAKVRLFGV
jgi:type I restriction enzyme R subunit